jgi:hypothetical protein
MHDIGKVFTDVILGVAGARVLEVEEVIQDLWSGYGKILRVRLEGGELDTVVVKHVRMPTAAHHPRVWNSDLSHGRKVRSYEIETAWYRDWSARCDESCRIPRFLAFERDGDEVLMVLEDLDASGYPERMGHVGPRQIEVCLAWLANFHATFMGEPPTGLWRTGTYWHLETRPQELEALDDPGLRSAAGKIDRRLDEAKFKTVVHGDAKLANFCFSEAGDRVAAVDFQYVGGGCGMKDVAYFVGSCLDERACEERGPDLLDRYFSELRAVLSARRPEVDADALEAEWRGLYPVAWTDFHRFLKGWSPGHWKINSYSERLAREVVAEFGRGDTGQPAARSPKDGR